MTVSPQIQRYPDSILAERAGYFPVPGAHLYTVLHEVKNPVARTLLVGPFASERHSSYLPWVRWARYLAAKGIEVLRYDYRGVGESTGLFEHMTLESWIDDVQLLSAWLRKRGEDVPLILHGLELGALLAARTFHNGEADGLILWSAPANANSLLRSTLQRWIGPQQLLKRENERKPASHYFRLLEGGKNVEVEGYEWSAELWRQSFSFGLPAAMMPPSDPTNAYKRPVRIVALGKNATPLVKGGVAGFEESKDFNWLFAPNYHWIASSFSIPVEAS
jgi:pimeloyl-ACP methyl ester carboxylesterase